MSLPSPLDYLYDEDISGYSQYNKVVSELHLVTSGIEPGDFSIIVPKMMPYFKESMVVKHVGTNRVLIPGVDWQAGHLFESAAYETEWVRGGIYGSILIMDRTLLGEFELVEYQTLGGDWVLSNGHVLEILTQRLIDPRTMSYEVVADKPTAFPPTGHNHPIDDWIGFSDVVSGLDRLTLAVENRTAIWLDNPPILMSEYYIKDETETVARAIANEVVGSSVADEMQGFTNAINGLQSQLTSGLGERFNKIESDARYYQKSQVFTKTELNAIIASSFDNHYTKANSDARYYNKFEVDSKFSTERNTTNNNHYTKTQTYTRAEIDTKVTAAINTYNYIRVSGATFQAYVSSAWRTVWPPQWQ